MTDTFVLRLKIWVWHCDTSCPGAVAQMWGKIDVFGQYKAGDTPSQKQLSLLKQCPQKYYHCLCTPQCENHQETLHQGKAELILRRPMEKNKILIFLYVSVYISTK